MKIKFIVLLFAYCGITFGQNQTPIRIMSYNVSDYSSWSNRIQYLREVINNIQPDIVVAIELLDNKDGDFLTNALNYYTPNLYSEGTFIISQYGGTRPSSNCLYYKNSMFTNPNFTNEIIYSYDASNNLSRDINRFSITQNGGKRIVIYAVHLSPTNATDRQSEIQYLLNYFSNNPSTQNEDYILVGDFNIKSPDEGAYKGLFASQGGYFYDPSNPTETFGSSWDQPEFIDYLSFSSSLVRDKFDNILCSAYVMNNIHGIQYIDGTFTVYGNPGSWHGSSVDPELSASDHLPVYADFNFTDNSNPVELKSFGGKFNESGVLLNWKTATEVNNFGFDIERLKDNSSWLKIGFVQGHGNSNTTHYYKFTDTTFSKSGTYYYRLKQVDNDGAFEYSNVISIAVNLSRFYILKQNYPNPFNPVTIIEYQIPKSSYVTIKVYSTLGEEIKTLVNEYREAGSYKLKFDASKLSSGIYFYRMTTGNYSSVRKMILQK